MALIEVNGKDGLRMRAECPRIGAWHADLRVDSPDAVTSPVTIDIADGTLTLVGSVVRGDVFVDAAEVRVVAGAGRLQELAKPRHYVAPTVRSILAHILGDKGEALSATVSAALLNRHLDHWTTAALPGGALLARLCATLGADIVWRFLPDGTVWLGTETWPDSGLRENDDYQVLEEKPEAGYALLGIESDRLLPGTTLDDRRISRAVHEVGDVVRTRVWFEDEDATTDRTIEAWHGALGGSVVDTFYRGSYVGELIQQEDDTVDVRFKDPRLPSMAKVPIYSAVPGLRTDGATGGRVSISWGGADPSQPRAESFNNGTTGGRTVIHADQILLGGDDGDEPAVLGDVLAAILETIAAHTHAETGTTTNISATLATLPDCRARKVRVV
jgi:hypothetical protein